MRSTVLLALSTLVGCSSADSSVMDLGLAASDLSSAVDAQANDAGDFAVALVQVSGVVYQVDNGGNAVPAGGVLVEVVGASPPLSMSTAADGAYKFMLASGSTQYVRVSKSSCCVPVQTGFVVSASGLMANFVLVLKASVAAVATSLSFTYDPAMGEIIAQLVSPTNSGGYGATLSVAHGQSYAWDLNGNAVASSTTLANGIARTVTFPNTVPGTTTVTGTAPSGKSCTPDETITNYRVDPGVYTLVTFTCT